MIDKLTQLPPADEHPDEFVVTRKPYAQQVVVRTAAGDSYETTAPVLRRYLQLCGMQEHLADKAVDWLWNYNAIHVDLVTFVFTHVPYQTAIEVYGNEEPLVYAPLTQ